MLLKNVKAPAEVSNRLNEKKSRLETTFYVKKLQNNNILKINFKYINDSTFNLSNTDTKIKPLISYIINVNLSKSNTIISILDKEGNLKGYYTSGVLGFKGSQKTKKYTIITMLKNFLYNFNFINNKSVLVNFKGVTKDQNLFIKKLKEKVSIKAINYDNLLPHNGCRPKKIRRK
jgi:small subunit ribosomal protein S11